MKKAKSRIAILGTGGTIAGFIDSTIATTGYAAGAIDIDVLIKAVPQIRDLADISWEQIANIDSSNMCDEIWLRLAKKIAKLFAEGIDGVVITHGTDTMEETAYFLNLTIKSDKPVVLVGAMRPSTAISADGPKNLYNAVALVVNKEAKNKGVMVAINDKILSARGVVKTHSLNVDAFSSPDFGDLGYIVDGKVFFYNNVIKAHTKNAPFDVSKLTSLPKVDILYSYSNDGSGVAAKALFEHGTKGIVVAGSGAGSIHKNQKDVLKELLKKGLKVVVSSRVVAGCVAVSDSDEKLGFISAEDLNPQKARVLLMLALTKTSDPKKIQEYFLKY
ncbi:L-asparaginase [Campylobacter jejuni subsp. jejuni NCTC 11168-K12E5]|uniref:L-asparagine amidohydrolase n=2 Tax=Campylobacter jejuni TaxID=197 RepID=Q0PC96_CAMJE|nr:type II asparaginase [Campylobacter jejuni]YP_002343501.1 L-asparaginase [Campylobacter jejuni subsp. jejuni NCTC 11168 = ATCC 700819]AHK51412.1 L-asparaginase [Campylobacter jejuni subsp. jejuni NCTC 11168-K12E5]AHK53077.1 L-asparaginase [Campylobacter jejuni subsp. jejuni NCTC 11168-Kf1]AHK54743.1 L-asparaginase [Campylobacter jejuni subsp. jejuni NCTC 11168-mcK12E5]AHK56408.1 L-asparaginase [Campylobacter jejuni subsp. jejuni NCTC 11168-mfK12E5]AHK58072.1 L-asparaginase [Campylobacter j